MMDGVSQTIRMLEQSPVIEGQFSQFVESTDWQVVTQTHPAKIQQDVLRALAQSKLDVDDFAALISPAAEPYLLEMVTKSEQLTLQRF